MNKENIIDFKSIIMDLIEIDNISILYDNTNIFSLFNDILYYDTFYMHLVKNIYDPFDNKSYNGLLLTIDRSDENYDAIRNYFLTVWNLITFHKNTVMAYAISKDSSYSDGVKLVLLHNQDNISVEDISDHVFMVSPHDYIRILLVDLNFYKHCSSGQDNIEFATDEFNILGNIAAECATEETESDNSSDFDWITDDSYYKEDDNSDEEDEEFSSFFDYYYDEDYNDDF